MGAFFSYFSSALYLSLAVASALPNVGDIIYRDNAANGVIGAIGSLASDGGSPVNSFKNAIDGVTGGQQGAGIVSAGGGGGGTLGGDGGGARGGLGGGIAIGLF